MTYRVDNHQPQNVYRDDAYIGVMFTAEDAALVVEALNERMRPGVMEGYRLAIATLADVAARTGSPAARWAAEYLDADPDQRAVFVVDSCSCGPEGPDVACVVHHGRRARGPKPPPLGAGCICDGSGRTCPRHGAVS